jgi:hypothetical protein
VRCNDKLFVIVEERSNMESVRRLVGHPAGKAGLTIGLAIGLVAALMGRASTALILVGFCRFLASKLGK